MNMGDFRGPPLPPPILEDEGWRLQVYEKDTMLVCYNKTITHATGVWKAENALLNTLPTFFTQLALILTFTYLLKRLFKPLRISCLVANVLVSNFCVYRSTYVCVRYSLLRGLDECMKY